MLQPPGEKPKPVMWSCRRLSLPQQRWQPRGAGQLQPLLLPEPLIQPCNSCKRSSRGIQEGFQHLLGKVLGFHPYLLLRSTEVPAAPMAAGTPLPLQGLGQLGCPGSDFGDLAVPELPRCHHSPVPPAGWGCVVLVWGLQLRDCSPPELCGKLSTKPDFSVHLS